MRAPQNFVLKERGPLKAPSESRFMWNDHSSSKMQDKGRGAFPSRLPCPSYLLECLPPYLSRAPGKKKGHDAEFNCVNLPNPHPWHFCFGSQTLLVFLGVSVPLKDIIKPFFPFEKCRSPQALHLHVSSLLCKLQLMCRRCRSLNTEHEGPVGDLRHLLGTVVWIPGP